jgi:3-dehydroquinate synthase
MSNHASAPNPASRPASSPASPRRPRTQTIDCALGQNAYAIVVGVELGEKIVQYVRGAIDRDKVVILSSPKVAQFHVGPLKSALEQAGCEIDVILFPDSEEYKILPTVTAIAENLAEIGCDRHTLLINCGGGVVCDMGGFVGATYMRGVRWINLPTTLLAQCDAGFGGKTGVNLDIGKNLVGVFRQPAAVFSDINYLLTLAEDEYKNGLAEVVKYGMIWDEGLMRYLERNVAKVLNRNLSTMTAIVRRCTRIKAEIVARDEQEAGTRRVLNFGHTIGHALETATGYQRFRHGFCISVGMVAETLLALKMELIESPTLERLEKLLDRLGLPRAADDIDIDRIMNAMTQDKKRRHGRHNLILPLGVGEVCEVEDVPPNLLREVLEEVIVTFDW